MLSRIFSCILIGSVLMVGCKKEETILEKGVNYSGPILVSFNNYAGYVKYNAEFIDKWDTLEYQVKIANTTATSKTPIVVSLIKDDNPIYEYNTLNGTTLAPIASNAYKLIEDQVTIQSGARLGTFKVLVNPTKLGSGNRALGISINKATSAGQAVAVNEDDFQSRLIIEVGALNAYDGFYNLYFSLTHPSSAFYQGVHGTTSFLGGDDVIALVTSGPNAVSLGINFPPIEFRQPYFYNDPAGPGFSGFTGVNPAFDVDPATGAVTVIKAVSTSADLLQSPGEAAASKFYNTGITGVPFTTGKRTLVAHFHWSVTGADRVVRDTLVFEKKR